jgi:hypothetical protein
MRGVERVGGRRKAQSQARRRARPKGGPARKRGRLRFRFDLESVMCLVAAGLMAAIGAFMVRDLYWLDRRGEVVTATVLDESSRKNPSITVRYVTRAGQTIENDTSNYYEAKVGGTIDVLYDREDPYRMQAADYGTDPWVQIVIFGGVTLVFLAFGVAGLWPERVSR